MLFDEEELFRAFNDSGARALLIGRRAMIALGLPVLTADYDLWVHIDDIEQLNEAARELDLFPNHPPAVARARGRYVLENSERVDVLVARRVSTKEDPPDRVSFDDLWSRRQVVAYAEGVPLCIPTVADLIRTKRFGMRRRDVVDIGMLEVLLEEE